MRLMDFASKTKEYSKQICPKIISTRLIIWVTPVFLTVLKNTPISEMILDFICKTPFVLQISKVNLIILY